MSINFNVVQFNLAHGEKQRKHPIRLRIGRTTVGGCAADVHITLDEAERALKDLAGAVQAVKAAAEDAESDRVGGVKMAEMVP